MRKDYLIETTPADESEAAFIERYWTEVWQKQGGPKGAFDRIPGKDEYKLIRPWLDRLPKEAQLLDGGCGLGDWTVFLTRAGMPTLGLDLSRETVAALKRTFPEAEFTAGDIRATGLADASFDGYFSWGVFEHFEGGMRPCLDEAFRVLKPGGMLFVSVPFDNLRTSLQNGRAKYRLTPADVANRRFYQYRFTRAELASEIALGGFEVIDVAPIHKRQGVVRALNNTFGMHWDSLATKVLGRVLEHVLPGAMIAHMILAIARKPGAV